MKELDAVIAAIRNAKCNGRHDGLGKPVIAVDLYMATALRACDEVERLRAPHDMPIHFDDIIPSGTPCAGCGGPVREFTIGNKDWNTIIRDDGPERTGECLCLKCFAHAAAEKVREKPCLECEIERLQKLLASILRHWQEGIEELHTPWRSQVAKLVGDVEGLKEAVAPEGDE